MKKKEIIFLISFSSIGLYLNSQKYFINLISKNFKEIYFMNINHLKFFPEEFAVNRNFDKRILKKFPRNIKFFNPKTFKELDNFFKNKNPLVINNIGRTFEVYGILYYLKKNKISQILVGHTGNIQASIYYWHKYNLNIIKYFFTQLVSRWITRILVFFNIFSQIDIRFISNYKIYKGFQKNSKSILGKIFPPYYKEFILVKSKIFDDDKDDKKNLSEKYIVHLDPDPDYREMKDVNELDKNLIKENYKKLNKLLMLLSDMFKKEVIISIHPMYDQKNTEKRFKNFKVVKMKTEELIRNSFIVVFFDSSAILQAIKLKKKIIAIRSKLFFQGKKYNSDLYADRIELKRIDIFKKINLSKSKLLIELNKNVKKYDNYLREYSSSNFSESGSKQIIKLIKSRYF